MSFLLLTQPCNFYLETNETFQLQLPLLIPPGCRRAGVQTASELLAEEATLMDYEEHSDKRNISTSEHELSVDEEPIPPHQQPRIEPPTPIELSTDIPKHIYEDLCGYWRSHSYFQSRVGIFEGFATDGPFPSVANFNFQDDPQTGLTRKFASELNDATQTYKEKICKIHARNYGHLATNELNKINSLLAEARELYDNKLLKETLQRAKIDAFNKAREIRRRKNSNQKKRKHTRSPSRGRSRESRRRSKNN